MGSLTARQARFVDEYLVDGNASAAYRRAGYSVSSADVAKAAASRLLTRVNVAGAIAGRQQAICEKLHVTQERVVAEYARIAFADLRSIMEWGPDGVRVLPSSDLDPDTACAVAEVSHRPSTHGVTIRVKVHDKVAALNALAKHLGLFPEATPAQVPALVPVQIVVSGHDQV